jgi:hypothetical protein
MKKVLSIILSVALIFNIAIADGNVISEVCEDTGNDEYFPITDERGNIVLTKKEINRDCTLTKEVQGACIKWETIKEDFVIDAEDYDAFRSRNHEGSLGSLLAMIGAYDQLEHLWSGWKGYCEVGTKTNFDWASDPMFWAGLVASAIMDGAKTGANGSTTGDGAGFLADTDLGSGIRGAQDSMTSALGPLGTWVGADAGKCLMASGFDLTTGLYQYLSSNESDDMCDPVDEFCGDKETQTEESDIITIDKVQYDDMIAQHPELAEYIIILGEEDGILTIRYKNLNEMEGVETASQAELDAMKEQLKQYQLLASVAITSAKLASCMASKGAIGTSVDNASNGAADENPISVKNGLGMAISSIPAEWMGPYGALIKAAMQILLNFLYSFQDIDSCHNEDDADEQGTRHKKTYEALPHNLCYFVYDKCVDNCGDAFLGMAKELRGYNYCCYDQVLTKVLVVQLKAQLGRDWSHCTGITLRDLNYVSFRQCRADEMANGIDGGKEGLGNIGSGKDGTPKSPEEGGYDPKTTFQYKNKCIDLTEFKDYLSAQIGDDIDLSDFDSIFNDVKGQAGGL